MSKDNFKVNFIGIGATRCGTTWISKCLSEHPEICFSRRKEVKFFMDKYGNYEKGIKWYKKQFPQCGKNKIKGEFTPEYLYSTEVPQRIKECFPKTKLIICLRNPIERVYSNYFYQKNRGKMASLSFEKAIAQNPDFIKSGFYYQQINEYLKLFPRNNILITIYEDIKKDPLSFIQKIYSFLGVDRRFVPKSINKIVNPTKEREFRYLLISLSIQKTKSFLRKNKLGRKLINLSKKIGVNRGIVLLEKINTKKEKVKLFVKPPMKPETRVYLQEIYKEDIKHLEKLLNRDLSFWK